MSFVAAFAALLLAEAASTDATDYAAIQAVHADEIVLPITRCAQTKLAAQAVQEAQAGSREAATKAFGENLTACGLERGQQELQARLLKAFPAATKDDTLRQARTAFAIPVVMVLADAMTKFGVPLPPSPPTPAIDVPCPPKGQPQPEPCRTP